MNNLEINERIVMILCTNRTEHKYVVKSFDLPKYTDSLDLCHEFEKDSTLGYIYNLMTILLSPETRRDCSVEGYSELDLRALLLATPLQRCEAFLRMKGQWDES